MSKKDLSNIFNKLAAKEQSFFDGEILSPVYKSKILVKIEGVTVSLGINNFSGWGVFKTRDRKTAYYVRQPTVREKQTYLDLFPQVSLMVVGLGDVIHGISVLNNRIEFDGVVPIFLPETVELFDVIFCRFNGKQIWFESTNRRYPRNIIGSLRDSLERNIPPQRLTIEGVSDKERAAYQIVFNDKMKGLMADDEFRFKDAITRGGGDFISYRKQGDSYSITYTMMGHRHTSTFDKNMMTQSPGFCLNGTHGLYDAQSLMGVLKEGYEKGLIHRW